MILSDDLNWDEQFLEWVARSHEASIRSRSKMPFWLQANPVTFAEEQLLDRLATARKCGASDAWGMLVVEEVRKDGVRVRHVPSYGPPVKGSRGVRVA